MKIGLIDVDNRERLTDCFPNLPLMKISAWHKGKGDTVEWYDPLFGGHYDKVYISKVFSFSHDYEYFIDADEIIYGGSGYAIELVDGKEVYNKGNDKDLQMEIEHIFPDYSLYGIHDTAYGFMSRGCPRGCDFCHVKSKEGLRSYKVADLGEFWNGQKNIQLCDPNVLACKDWEDILQQLADSRAYVEFNQGLDIRLMTERKAELIRKIKVKTVHFAWDRYEDGEIVKPRFEEFQRVTGWDRHKMQVYVLCGFDTTMDQNLERIYWLRDHKYSPYVMLYNKQNIPEGDDLRKLQRWVNSRFIFNKVKRFEDYKKGEV